ncbi:MAG: DNA-processing protein DprA [Bacilli bacterium]|nr:DNA-processing protein DprA [Bacilli bacterium]
MTEKDVLFYLSMKHNGEFEEIMNELRTFKELDVDVLRYYYDSLDCGFITLMDKRYPESLKRCFCPPLVLYYYGNIDLLKNFEKTYAYVGSREASEYGLEMARRIGSECAKKGLTLVSGLARGIDGAVMEAALDAGGKVIGVLGTAINRPYPNINKDLYKRTIENGLVLSEYPPDVEALPSNFPKRNRIIAAVGRATIVGESAMKSGTLTTVRHALELGREVGAVPHESLIENGCNQLIRDGAWLIENADDVVDILKASVLFQD